MAREDGSGILKPASDKRTYKLMKLCNGLEVLLVADRDIANPSEDSEEDDDSSGDDEPERGAHEHKQRFPFQRPQFPSTCTGFGREDFMSEDFMSEMKIQLPCHPDEEGVPNSAPTYSRFKHNSKKLNRLTQDKTEDSAEELSYNVAAAAMCVGVGGFSDPPEAQGLAHYLEHMLFMGSAKFPDENEYNKFLSRHRGKGNASTEPEFTRFHFQVGKKCFRGALERFSQFFISPLVKVEAMDREIQAIESEFVRASGYEINRLHLLHCHTAFPSHPHHHFIWGNRKSLQSEPAKQGIDVRAKLLQLFHDHYRAGRMKLVVLGGSLETLKKWVVELFGEVKEGGEGRWSPASIPSEGCRIWPPNRLYRVAGISEQNMLIITFPLPCQESAYRTKPQDYCSRLVAYGGKGGLLAVLGREGWATWVKADCGINGLYHNSIVYLLSVSISLTVEGADHVMEVIGLLFQYLKVMRSEGLEEWIFQEQKTISKLNFEYDEPRSLGEYARSLATNMLFYPKEHIIYGEFAQDLWKPELVMDVLSRMSPANMRVDLVLHNFDRTAPGVLIEPWCETPFTVETIPKKLLKLWANPPYVDPHFHLPVHNEFIPQDFTVFESKADALRNPSCILDSAGLKVWHRNRRFKTPRICACFSIMFFPGSMQVTDAVFAQLYVGILRSGLHDTIYLARAAKLLTKISLYESCTLLVTFIGFSDKLPLLVGKVANHMKGLTTTEGSFERQVEQLSKNLKSAHEEPTSHANSLLSQFLSVRYWDTEKRSACLPSLTFEDFTKFSANFYSRTYIECFINGNARRKDALVIAKVFKEALVSRPLPPGKRATNSVGKLPAGIPFVYRVNCRSEFQKNSVVQLYFQLGQDHGKDSIKLQALTDLFKNIISEPYYDQLRTKEQLGYNVQCQKHKLHGVMGIYFMVESPNYSPQYIEGRLNAFIKKIPQLLMSMKEEEFQCHKDSVINFKKSMHASLLYDSEVFWEQIWSHRYSFDAPCMRLPIYKE